jgi:hypothetical protein
MTRVEDFFGSKEYKQQINAVFSTGCLLKDTQSVPEERKGRLYELNWLFNNVREHRCHHCAAKTGMRAGYRSAKFGK